MEAWEKGQLNRAIRKLQAEVDAVTRSCKYFQRRCNILERIIADHVANLLPPRGFTQQEKFFEAYMDQQWTQSKDLLNAGPETFLEFIEEEIRRNESGDLRLRRWSATTVMFCFVLMTLGSKSS